MFKLFPFQREGRDFLLSTQRCLLADEMGLGKTIQVLAAVKHWGISTNLIIAPASLLLMWEYSIKEMFGDYAQVILLRTGMEPHVPRSRCIVFVLCSYNFIQQQRKKGKNQTQPLNFRLKRLLKRPWDLIVSDESQKMKN